MIRWLQLFRQRQGRSAWVALAMAVAFTGLASPQARAQAGRVLDWRADQAPAAGVGWGVERFGALREAGVRLQAAGAVEGAAARAILASADDKPPPAQLVFPVAFQAGHRYRITIELSSTTPTRADVMIRRGPPPYDPMAIRSLTLGPTWQTASFEGNWPITSDKGGVRVVARQAQSEILIRRTLVDDLGPLPLGNVPQANFPPTLIGIHVNKLGAHTTWPQAGQGLIRLWDTGTTWNNLAPTRKAFDDFSSSGWKRLEAYVDYVRRNQPSAAILMTLGTPPRWASDSQDASGCAYGPRTCGAPASMDEWRHYVRTVAERYKGRIRHWELWNEADYRFFYSSKQSLAELAQTASEELKRVDPLNILVSPGFTAATGMNALQTFLQNGGGKYVDVIGFHWYFDGVPEKLAVAIANVQELMKANGVEDKPIWNTEGAPLCQRRDAGQCVMNGLSTDDQDSVTPRAILTMWLNGVRAYAYYTVEGAGDRTIPLLQRDLIQPTRAAQQLQMFSSWMVGAELLRIAAWGKTGHALELRRGSEHFYVAWTEGAIENYLLPTKAAIKSSQVLGDQPVIVNLANEQLMPIGPVLVKLLTAN